MNRATRGILTMLSAATVFSGLGAPAAIAGTGCSGLCSVDGWLLVTATRSTPCTNFGGSVCYILQWSSQVSGSSLVSGNYTATTTPDAGAGHSRTCFFLSPATTSCSATGHGNSFIDIVPPNSTTCHSFSTTLKDTLNTTVATDSGSQCRSVGS